MKPIPLLFVAAVWPFMSSVRGASPALPFLKLQPVPFNQVQIEDRFWRPKQETNRLGSIPANLENLEKAGNIRNFELAGAGKHEGYSGPVFMDSDLYKGLEAAAYSLANHPDPELEKKLDEIIAKIAAAQQADGYLNTHFQVVAPDKKWSNLRDWHELYCAGHLFEGAVAHYQATGKRNFLEVAIKLADCIDKTFGPGKRMGYPGHPEIELALIKLWRVTGEPRYFELARFFVENRGQKFFATEHKTPLDRYDGAYWQDDIPICDHRNIKGHAVRACYLLAGATDVVAETADPALLKMLHRVWRNTTERNMYLTGGIGPSAHNEGFTTDYDLPNLTAYQETCASVALALWNHRLALMHGDARFADVFERSLYNGVLSGVSRDGKLFFYVNPLESRGTHHRSQWFGCACCPPNVARTLASIGGYAYGSSKEALWVNLYIQGSVELETAGQKTSWQITTDYPWDGKVSLAPKLSQPRAMQLRLRIPGWSRGTTVAVNGQSLPEAKVERGYFVLDREWKNGDTVELNIPMPVERMAANPNVKADQGLLAIQRGPLVYCFEEIDQAAPLSTLCLPTGVELEAVMDKDLLGGVMVVKGSAQAYEELDWTRTLYQAAGKPRKVAVQAIPYYAWDNRRAGPMKVWLPTTPKVALPGGLESQAKVTVSFANNNSQPHGINDGVEPKKSGEQPEALCHWWPHKASSEWVQYSWKKPVTVQGTRVYWFDDTGRGNCRLPKSWQIEYLEEGQWKKAAAQEPYAIEPDRWCEVKFPPITTTALRLRVDLQQDWAAGVHEWKLIEAEEE